MKENDQSSKKHLYRAIWRWHFYAGVIFAPILIMLAVTGAIYLYKPQIQEIMYKDLYEVKQQGNPLSANEQVIKVQEQYPDSPITRVRPADSPTRSTEVGIDHKGENMTIFINPYNGKIMGDLKDDSMFMEFVKKLHGELMVGTIGDRIVELAACWAIILLVTGLYLWFPRDKNWNGFFNIRLKQGKRTFYRDLHVFLGFWLSLFIILLILTGLPWAGFMGDKINQVATSTQSGYPNALWDEVPESYVPTKSVGTVPWAAENMPLPKSNINGTNGIFLNSVVEIAEKRNVHPGYNIYLPGDETGVYTVSVFPTFPKDQATLHIDQYSGKVLADLRFDDYGWMAKVIEVGIALHEGRYFGPFNQFLGLLTCLGLVLIVWSGFIMWWKRRPTGKLGAPTLSNQFKMSKTLIAITILLGILLPLVGISLLAVLIIDFVLIKRIPRLREWFA
ncbi:PepSY-associated TM helix domain-containing protein [Peribacillus alkalitolerans]|uniref:PepSY-associated TM helix domain-containing protein n=1 Tax=Peribacillus alkalitolerans TaxID=1550385 RepID=UPI0013D451DD|nr:PepSY domain-containing protein [Peribacillus alkalitolerans]